MKIAILILAACGAAVILWGLSLIWFPLAPVALGIWLLALAESLRRQMNG